jgi:hypothetical protein
MYKSLAAILAVANAANLLELELDNAVANSAFGVDVSQAMSLSTAQCLKSYGYSWVVPRGWCSYGAVDTSVCTTLKNAQSAGITTRDVYMFPCPTCSASAASQISSLVSYL